MAALVAEVALGAGDAGPSRRLVVAAVLRREGRVLLCRRPPGKRHGDLWELPGGKVHPGETPAAALRRELAEELDLALVTAGAPLAELADPGSEFVIRFLPAIADGEPVAREHTALAWVTPAEATGYALAPSDRRFVELGLLAAPAAEAPEAADAGEG